MDFLNSKPNTLHGILTTEKDKTDRQGYEFSVQDLTVENLNTYNDCFVCYKELIENFIIGKYEDFLRVFESFDGFILNTKGDSIFGKVPAQEKIKDLIINCGKKIKNDYHNGFTVSFKKRI